ncbi:hypothetical protein AGMMS50229_02090 [Campylobacterota bacterium]|nr:hypothetical protein AGMMS50229_02090 [Campylobacterota bacterium]
MGRIIVYGDIHGCLDEWQELRKKIGASANDTEISVGDLVSKGTKVAETIRYARENGVITVLGNHEDRYLEIATGVYGQTLERERILRTPFNNASDLAYLFAMPRFVRIANLTIVHAGLTNSVALDRLHSDHYAVLTRLRYIGTGAMDYRFWSELYNGNQGFVVYGHTPCNIRRDRYALGIDTGCVYGGKLTAAIFTRTGSSIDTKNYAIADVSAHDRYA